MYNDVLGPEMFDHDDPFIILPDQILYDYDRDSELVDHDEPLIILPDEIMYDNIRGQDCLILMIILQYNLMRSCIIMTGVQNL